MTVRSWFRNVFAPAPRTADKNSGRARLSLESFEARLAPATVQGFLASAVAKAAPAPALTLTSVASLTDQHVRLRFNTPLGSGATSKANYAINGLTVERAQLEPDRRGVILTTSPQQVVSYTVTASNLRARNGPPLAAPLTATVQGSPAPALLSVKPLNSTSVMLKFNTLVSAKSARNPASFVIDGLTIRKARLLSNATDVVLTTTPQENAPYSVGLPKLRTQVGNLPLDTGPIDTFVGFPGDQTPPRVVAAVSTANNRILVAFSEPMTDAALNPTYYKIAQTTINPEAGSLRVLGTRPGEDQFKPKFATADRNLVELSTTPQNELGYTLTAFNLTDLAGNPFAPPTISGNQKIDPAQAAFLGTPPTQGELIDTDGDGLTDNDEMRGWLVTVVPANGQQQIRGVSSDPYDDDTDDDGFTDNVEAQLRLDPRDPDSDDDLLTDYQEYTEIFSDHLKGDTDGDGVDDGTEFLGVFSSPTHADTDGDQIPDGEEIPNPNRNPLEADLPTPAIEVGNINLQLDVRFTETTSAGTRELQSKSVTSSLTQSQNKAYSNSNSNTQEAMAKLTVGTEFTIDPSIFALLGGTEFKTNVQAETGWTGSWTTENTASSEQATEEAYGDSLTTDAETTIGSTVERTVTGAKMQVSVFLRNASNMAYNVRNLQLTAFTYDPADHTKLTPVATLVPEQASPDGINLGPLVPDRGPFIFANDSIFPGQVEALMQNPGSVVFRISNFDIVDEAGRNFAFSSLDVSDRTAGLVIDFGGADTDGDGEGDLSEYHRVSLSAGRIAIDTNGDGQVDDNDRRVVFDRQGVHVGTTLRQALLNLRLTHYDETTTPSATLSPEQLRNSYSTVQTAQGIERIFRIRDVARQEGVRKAWEILTPEGIIRPASLDDVVLTAKSDIKLAFFQDVDGDHLPANLEFLYGTSDETRYTDGDSLDDRFEALIGYQVDLGPLGSRRVFPDPTSSDADGDKVGDNFEAPFNRTLDADGLIISAVKSGPTDLVTDPRDPDTDNDGVSDFDEYFGYTITLRNPPPGGPNTIFVQTNAENPDTDGDGVRDGDERRLGGNPTDPSDRDQFADDDGDGLANVEETDGWDLVYYQRSTTSGARGPQIVVSVTADPTRADSDGDGIPDGEEFTRKLHPRRADSDLDGLTDFQELRGFQLRDQGLVFTDPLDADTDHDRLRDGDEAELVDVEANRWIVRVEGKAPYRVYSHPRVADGDFDGVADGDERTVGSDPTKANTDGDKRDDGAEIGTIFNPLAEDFRVTVSLVNLTITDDADDGTLHGGTFTESGAGEFSFGFSVIKPNGSISLFDNSDLPGYGPGTAPINTGTSIPLNANHSFAMTTSEMFRINGYLLETDTPVFQGDSTGTEVTFGNLNDTPIAKVGGSTSGPGFFQGSDLIDDPLVQYYTVTFGAGDNQGLNPGTVWDHIKGSLKFAITVEA